MRDVFGYDIPSDHVGEYWAISAHPNGVSIVANGLHKGKALDQLYAEHRDLFGHSQSPVFPLLTKILDANQDLSVQVHPDNEYARIHEGELGKTESLQIEQRANLQRKEAAFDAELRVINSTFDKAPHDELGLHHLLYVGRIKHFVLEGSHLQRGYRGHLVKSRARLNEVRYNLLSDGPEGAASYELEFPEGGVAVVTGNVIAQSAASGNPVVIGYGAEAGNRPVNRLFLSHNTLINKGIRPAWFVRAWTDKLPAGTEIVTRNNLTVGFGLFTLLLIDQVALEAVGGGVVLGQAQAADAKVVVQYGEQALGQLGDAH